MDSSSSSSSSIINSRPSSGSRRPRPPAPGTTLIPPGFEAVSHPCLHILRRPPPPPPKCPSKMTFAPYEASDECIALSSSSSSTALPAARASAPHTKDDKAVHRHNTKNKKRSVHHEEEQEEQEEQEDEDLTCAICLSEYSIPVTCITANCMHNFCKACITRWLSINMAPSSSSSAAASSLSGSSSSTNARSCPLCKRGILWLLSISAASSPVPPFRFVLMAVGPDAEALEQQPWPEAKLLQEARQKQLDLYEAKQRKIAAIARAHERKEEKKVIEKRKTERYRPRVSFTSSSHNSSMNGKDPRPVTECIKDELEQINLEIAKLKRSKKM